MDESVEKPSCFDPEVWIPYVRSPTYLAFRLFSVHSTLAIAATHRLTEIVLAGGDEDENADEFDLPDEDTVTCKIEFGWYLRTGTTRRVLVRVRVSVDLDEEVMNTPWHNFYCTR